MLKRYKKRCRKRRQGHNTGWRQDTPDTQPPVAAALGVAFRRPEASALRGVRLCKPQEGAGQTWTHRAHATGKAKGPLVQGRFPRQAGARHRSTAGRRGERHRRARGARGRTSTAHLRDRQSARSEDRAHPRGATKASRLLPTGLPESDRPWTARRDTRQ